MFCFHHNRFHDLCPLHVKQQYKEIIDQYFAAIENYSKIGYVKQCKMAKSNELYVGLNGSLTPDQTKRYKALCDVNEKVFSSTRAIATILNRTVEFSYHEVEDKPSVVLEIVRLDESPIVENKWEDDDDRLFYECLKDLSNVCNPVSEKELEKIQKNIRDQYRVYTQKIDDFDDDFDFNEYSDRQKPTNPTMEAFLTKLKNCFNRDLIDGCVDDFFLYLNTKSNRKILVENIFGVSRDRSDLFPFYARFLASTYPYTPDMAIEVTILLRKEFYYHLRKHKQFNLPSKIKTVRFIGEMIKFKLFSKADGINFLKSLLQEFHGHLIDMFCHFLESVGRFLYNSVESRPLIQNILDILDRKIIGITEGEHKIMISNAINSCNPQRATSVIKIQKQLSSLHQFIKYLVFNYLNRSTIPEVVEIFKKIPMNQLDCSKFVIKCLTRPWKAKYSNISCMASLIFQIRRLAPNIDVVIVDEIIEEIRLGIETNITRYNQRRISTMKFFGELYNFQIIEADLVLSVSFSIITFGYHRNFVGFTKLDPPSSQMRINLICELYKTCGNYITQDPVFVNFDGFFVLFQAYFWRKKLSDYYCKSDRRFPIAVESNVKEMFEMLRLRKRYYDTPEKVMAAFAKQTDCVYKEFDNIMKKCLDSGVNVRVTTQNNSEVSSSKDIDADIQEPIDEEMEFERAYEKTIIDSLNEKGVSSNSGRSDGLDLVLPSNLMQKYIASQDVLEDDIKNKNTCDLKLCLLTKKNNKKVLKDFSIPKDDALAKTVIYKYKGKVDDKEDIKRIILNMTK